MSHELLRLTSKICNTPLMISDNYLDKVMQILQERGKTSQDLATVDNLSPRERDVNLYSDLKLGVVNIHGAISDVPYYGLCGEQGVSHQSIRQEVEQLIDSGVNLIVLDQDSGGGMAHMTFESANYIRNLADDNNVTLISYISGGSFSASYAYTAVAHEVIANPSSEMGSIGVRVQLRNTNGYMRKLGIEDTYITAGEGKVPFDDEGKFTQDFLSEIRESVMETYDQFVGHVSMWRGLEKDAVRALGAKTYSTKKGLSNGLIDKVMTLDEFKSYLIDKTQAGEEMSNPITNLLNKNKKKDQSEMSVDIQELESSLESLKVEFEAAKLANQALAQEKDSLQAQLEVALASLADIEEKEKQAKVEARKAKLSAVVGDAKAASLSKSLMSLSDEDFQDAINLFSGVVEAKEDELGDSGDEVQGETLSRQESVAKGMEEFLNKQYKKKGK